MIDLDWIASQPKPVAIHCPTYHDVMTVLCDVNERRNDAPLDVEEIINVANEWWALFGEDTCVRVRQTGNGAFDVYRHSKSFYEVRNQYILVPIDQVKRKFDLGEIESDAIDLSSLFGMEVRDEL